MILSKGQRKQSPGIRIERATSGDPNQITFHARTPIMHKRHEYL
jgi:hypothetical protein